MFKNITVWFKMMFTSDDNSRLLLEDKPKVEKEIIKPVEKVVISDYDLYINESNERLDKLKIFSEYFNNSTVSNIFTQSKYLHNFFVENKVLKISKLNQFHYYYTDKLFDLLNKVKTTTEDNFKYITSRKNSIIEKIKNIDTYIDNFKDRLKESNKFKVRHGSNFTTQLSSIYNRVVAGLDDFRYKEISDLKLFRNYLDSDAFYKIPNEVLVKISKKGKEKYIVYDDFSIDKKLMDILYVNLFEITFIGSFICGSSYLELFKVYGQDNYFIYLEDSNTFKSIDDSLLSEYISDHTTRLQEYIDERNEYQEKYIEIKALDSKSDVFDSETKETLKSYLDKIESVELVENITNVDVERLILESMIKLERLDI